MAKRPQVDREWWKSMKAGEEQMFEPEVKWNWAAFYYEFEMRLEKRKNFKPYNALPMLERLRLCREFEAVKPSNFNVWTLTDVLGKEPQAGWSPFRVMSWNLNLTNEPLVRAFIRLIEMERREAGIKRPRRNPVSKSRGLPWNVIGFLDARNRGVVLNDTERSQLSKALKAFAEFQDKRKANAASQKAEVWGVISQVKAGPVV